MGWASGQNGKDNSMKVAILHIEDGVLFVETLVVNRESEIESICREIRVSRISDEKAKELVSEGANDLR
jgi:hypothetical protein